MAIEIIPRKKEEESEGSFIRKKFLYIGLGFLFISVIISGTFLILIWMTSQESKNVRIVTEAEKSKEILLLESEMKEHYKRVADFAYLLSARVSPIPMFEVIERTIHPDVYFLGFQINPLEKKISTTGIARNITVFDQQIKIFEEDSMIVNVTIDNFTREDNGRVVFPLTFIFSEELFNLEN